MLACAFSLWRVYQYSLQIKIDTVSESNALPILRFTTHVNAHMSSFFPGCYSSGSSLCVNSSCKYRWKEFPALRDISVLPDYHPSTACLLILHEYVHCCVRFSTHRGGATGRLSSMSRGYLWTLYNSCDVQAMANWMPLVPLETCIATLNGLLPEWREKTWREKSYLRIDSYDLAGEESYYHCKGLVHTAYLQLSHPERRERPQHIT